MIQPEVMDLDCAVCGDPLRRNAHGLLRADVPETAELDKREALKIAAFAAVEATGTRQEVIELLWLAARRGSVSAMRLLLEELRRDGKKLATGGQASAPDFIDELARRRGR